MLTTDCHDSKEESIWDKISPQRCSSCPSFVLQAGVERLGRNSPVHTFKILAVTSWKNAIEKLNIYFFCLLISFISYSAVTVIKMLKGNFM